MGKRIFISYRRSDTQMAAGRLYAALVGRFGPAGVFRDKEKIRPGYDWVDEIQAALAGDVVVLALLGPDWAESRNAEGHRRLDDPMDTNRVELETALAKNRALIPVLIEGASVPAVESLPSSLRPLTRRNALRLRDDDWEGDFAKLADALTSLGVMASADARVAQHRPSPVLRRAGVAGLGAVALAGAVYWGTSSDRNESAGRAGVLDLAGTWRDLDSTTVGQVTQTGHSLRITRTGTLPNGVGFEAIGQGTIDGTKVSTQYGARYQTGGASTGSCAGSVSTDGARMELVCTDTVLGTFPVTATRQ